MKNAVASGVIVLLVFCLLKPQAVFSGYLYGTDSSTQMWKIDPTDGSKNLISGLGFYVNGLTYNNDDGYLYGTDSSAQMWKIDPTDGSKSLISCLGFYFNGLAYNNDDVWSRQWRPDVEN